MTSETKFSPGLEGVVACETRLSHVDGEAGKLIFSGHNAVDLAENKTVEEVWFLLRHNRLPDAKELKAFRAKVEEAGKLTEDEVKIALKLRVGEPLSAFRSILSAIASHRKLKPWLNRDMSEIEEEILALSALAPQIVEVIHKGKRPIRKARNNGYAERYLWGINGRRPDAEAVQAVETYLILTMDHGMNASTFSARVTASTGADVGAAITTGIGTLSGPLHGGAPGPVLDMLDGIGEADKAEQWVEDQLTGGRRIMGFGHRVYRTDDPRALTLRRVAEHQSGFRVDLAREVEKAVLDKLSERQKAKAARLGVAVRPLRVNVEFWTAVVLEHAGIPRELFSSTFCTSRIIGWGEHVREQIGNNKLFRPLSEYTGPAVE